MSEKQRGLRGRIVLCYFTSLIPRDPPRGNPPSERGRHKVGAFKTRSAPGAEVLPTDLPVPWSQMRQPSGDPSAVAPPVPIPNTAVKRCSPDDSACLACAKVGRRQSHAPSP